MTYQINDTGPKHTKLLWQTQRTILTSQTNDMCVYVGVCMRACVRACVCNCECMCVCVCVYVCMHVKLWMHVCVCTRTRARARVKLWMHVCGGVSQWVYLDGLCLGWQIFRCLLYTVCRQNIEYMDYQFWGCMHCLLIRWGKTVSAGMAESLTDPPSMHLRDRSHHLPSTF